jgi:hypothetical protein
MVMRNPVVPISRALVALLSLGVIVMLCGCGGTSASRSTEPSTNQEAQYIDASQRSAQQGNVRVSVTEVRVGRVDLVGFGGKGLSEHEQLQIKVLVKNLSNTKIVAFSRWQGCDLFRTDHVPLHDDFGNSYRNMVSGIFGSWVAEKEKDAGINNDIYPGMQVEDLLVFNPPVEGIKYLRLTLEAENFGGEGTLKFHIPVSMIGQREREREQQRQAEERERERQRLAEEREKEQRRAEERERERRWLAEEREKERQYELAKESRQRQAEAEAAERLRIAREQEAQRAKEKAEEGARKAKEALHAEKKYGGYDRAKAKALTYRNEALEKRNFKYKDVDDNSGITSERLDKNRTGREFWVFAGTVIIEVDGKELTSTWTVSPQFVPSAGETGLWRCNDVTIGDPK